MSTLLTGFSGAWNFLTILRIGRSTPPTAASLAWFPVVGALLGGALAGVHAMSAGRVPLMLEASLMVTGLVVITGALHLDGVADTFDAGYAGATPEDARRIMKDPHVGTMGFVAVVCLLLVKWSCFWAIGAHRGGVSWLVAPVVGRCAMGWTLAALPYVGSSEGTARPFLRGSMGLPLGIATAFTAVWSVWALGGWGGFVCLGSLTAWEAGVPLARRRFGGCTGDVIGAAGELTETAAWVITAFLVCGTF